jgi:hypothetical protein
MDRVQKHSNSECYTLSSEPFRIYYTLMTDFHEASYEHDAIRKLLILITYHSQYQHDGHATSGGGNLMIDL